MNTGRAACAGIGLFLITAFLITQAAFAAPPDYKTMPLHQVMVELKKTSDEKAREKIIDKIEGRNPETQQDRDALYEALDSRHKDIQLLAIGMVPATKEQRSIKKLVDNVKSIKSRSIIPPMIKMTVEMYLKLSDDVAVPVASVYALGTMKNEEALPIIVEKLGDITQRGIEFEKSLQWALLSYYGAMSLPHAAKKIEQLGDQQSVGKEQLIDVITYMRDKDGITELNKLAKSHVMEIRTAAFSALSAMGEKPDLTQIFADIDVTHAKLTEYYKKTRGQNKPYNELDEDSRLRATEEKLYRAIADSKNTDALPILEQRVELHRKKGENNFHKVINEVLTIRDIGGPEAFAYLKRLYDKIPVEIYDFGIHKGKKNITYKNEFLHYFGKKGFVEAVPFLEGIMNDTKEERTLRATAARVLSEITDDLEYYHISKEIEAGKR